ncbi:hypothetical protein MJM04_28540, partial [Salmonella enterica subsp. enterica serovar Cerro]|nr:hypothetical protein [Salmonella enterica subsp. enterica serovar Cerro]
AKALSAVYDNSWTLVAGYVVLTALASAFAAKIAPETVLPHSPPHLYVCRCAGLGG